MHVLTHQTDHKSSCTGLLKTPGPEKLERTSDPIRSAVLPNVWIPVARHHTAAQLRV